MQTYVEIRRVLPFYFIILIGSNINSTSTNFLCFLFEKKRRTFVGEIRGK